MTSCARCGAATDGSYRCVSCTGMLLPEANEAAAQEREPKPGEARFMPWQFDLLGLFLRGAVGKKTGE